MAKAQTLCFPLLVSFTAIVTNINDTIAGVNTDIGGDKTQRLAKAAGIHRPFWTPNRIGTYLSNDGALVDHHTTGTAGMEWPVGSGNHINFQSGIWLAGLKEGKLATAISEFVSEFQPGTVTGWKPGIAGRPADPQNNRFHVYIINQEDITNPPANDDYVNWPVQDGAPVDENGKPLLLGTSTAWAVFNDFDQSLHDTRFLAKAMGVEVQMTTWAYDRQSALGDMMFFKYTFINKSGKDITEAFVGIWADVDIGDVLDLVGCDTSLSLGYMYKTRRDAVYGDNPPAIGYDFFHGPAVPSPGDTATISGKKKPHFKNLPMTGFPPQLKNRGRFDDPANGQEVYNYMHGLDELGRPFVDPQTNQIVKFWATGDPVTGTGWLDPDARDKRMLLVSGPFHFADGDTQEVVGGIVIAQGESGLQSVEMLRRNDRLAQIAYEVNFALPKPPPSPVVSVSPDTTSIFLSWDDATEAYFAVDHFDRDENNNPTAYAFQGYNVYQLNAQVIIPETGIKKIASFDVIDGIVKIRDDVLDPETGDVVNRLVQDARDTGLKRFLRVTQDATGGNVPLIQNRKYYFAVTAYGYNPLGIPKTLESPLQVITARPQSPPLGTRLTTSYGKILEVTHTGPSDGEVYPLVVDPLSLTGQLYTVRFRTNQNGETVWDVVVADNEIKVSGWRNQSRSNQNDFPIVDGILVQVFSPHLGIAFVNLSVSPEDGGPGGTRWISGWNWGGSDFFGGMDLGANFSFGSSLSPGDYVTVDWRFTSDPIMSEETGWSRAYVYRRDLDNGFAGMGWIPCQMYDISDLEKPRRLNIVFMEDASQGLADLLWNPIAAEQAGGGPGGHEYLFCMRSDYDPEGRVYDDAHFGPGADVLYVLWPSRRGSYPYQESDFWIRIKPNMVNTGADEFTFKSEPPIRDNKALARAQAMALVNVYPNPYKGFNIEERDPINRFVTFTHLPETNATIQIFTLMGELVRKIQHTNGTQYERWDLRNFIGVPVASGIYIVRIDMGDLGVKVLKLAVFQPTEILDIY
jgi:hypothetical protein